MTPFKRRMLVLHRQQMLKRPERRHHERERARQIERPHVAVHERHAGSTLRWQFGDASATKALNESFDKDFQRAETLSLPITLLILVIAFVAAVVLFGIQNREMANMSFLGFSLRAPIALLAAVMYVLGAISGGSLYALLRKSIRESGLRGDR